MLIREVRSNKLEIDQPVSSSLDSGRFSRSFSWERLIAALMYISRFIQRKTTKLPNLSQMKDADLFLDTERMVIRNVQKIVYHEELNKSSPIFTRDPYLDEHGLLPVGGRLKRSHFNDMLKNPIILPAKHHITTLIARKCHEVIKHQGRRITEGRIRSSGYWIVGGKRLLTSMINSCITCMKLRKQQCHQKNVRSPRRTHSR